MAILEASKIESTSGFQKIIDADSMHMALDVLQKFQYQFPQKSTIRELAANAVDSIKERDIAKLIITGKAQVSDYYVEREGSEFLDSKFNPNYFNLKYLSDKKEAEIVYKEGNGITTKDRLFVTDYGVGLGGKRLENYFKLNSSSKRLSKSAIGKMGLGAKSPLSTGVDSYRMTTCHNGKKFTFDIYSHKVDSITEKFNSKGEVNPTHTFENGYTCYYENTTELNHTEVSIECKKHHRSIYTDAVRQQLLYFDNITYKVVDESGYERVMPTKATVIYEDDDIILSDNNQYSKPHIIIDKVCYSYINFLELELEDKNGNIGIKMDAENITISPSRESVIFDDKTRAEVTRKFGLVVDIASKEVEKQLDEKDFIKWLEKCSRVLSYQDSYSILGRLSRVIDKSAIKPTYPLDKTIKYKSPKEMMAGISITEVYSHQSWARNGNKIEIKRETLDSWNTLQNYKIYYTTGNANNLKDRYITHTSSSRFILLKESEHWSEKEYKEGKTDISNATTGVITTVEDQWNKYKEHCAYQDKLINLIKTSTESVNYDELVVPEDFKKKLEESEKVEEDGTVTGIPIPELSPAEKRKLDERTVLYYPQKSTYDISTNNTITNAAGQVLTVQKRHNWVKTEPKISEVLAWEGTVVYAFVDEDEMLLTAAWIIEQQRVTANSLSFFTDETKLVRISKGIKKYFKDHTHITEFFKQVNGTELNMNSLFVKWYTGKRIADALVGFEFLNNFSMFNQEMFDKYQELKTFEKENYKSLAQFTQHGNMLGCTPAAFKSILEYADSMAEVQISLEKDATSSEYTKIEAIDLAKYNLLQEVVEYSTPLKGILKYILPMINNTGIDFELESEIKEIMRNKGYE